jgi:hypothetical protein
MKIISALRWLILLAGAAAWLPAGAVNWTTTNGIGLGAIGGSIYCSTTTCSTSTSGLTGSVMTMNAYSTPTSGTPTPENGNWLSAKIAIYGGSGVGITNQLQGSAETSTPQHAMDNRLVNDILVVDFGSSNWDVSSFSLGYACTIDSAGTGCTGSTVNVSAWVGGSSAINFNTMAFSGSGSSATLPGFQALTLSNDPGGTGTKTESTSYLGRYLVISGDLGGYSSAFKISGLSAVQVTPPGQVPLPGTLPLFCLGLLALTLLHRRSANLLALRS